MQVILDILKRARGWHHGLSLTIDNEPYISLVIEAMDESGPCGLLALSVTHYGKQNGDLMRDPEMCFELASPGTLTSTRSTCATTTSAWSSGPAFTRTDYVFHRELHQQHMDFAKVWDRNLRSQGFLEAFDRMRQTKRS